MKLLLMNSIGRSKWGGGEKWMLMAASNLIKRGHDVYIACAANSILERKAKASAIPVLPVKVYSDFDIVGLIRLYKYFTQKQFDAVIGCQNKDVRVSGFLVKKVLKSKTLVFSRQGVQLLSNSVKYKIGFLPLCDGIITNTNSIKKEYDSYGWWNSDYVKVIYNGVEPGLNNVDSFNFKEFTKGTVDPFIILSTGRLSTQKGFKYLIDAAREVVKRHPNVFFFIAGKGKLKSELNEQIKRNGLESNVFLLGFKEDVLTLLSGANLFVLPSLFEGMPNAVMEAMSFGIPVVSTNVNGVSELMKDKEHGYIIPSADISALTDSIISVIEDPNSKEMGSEGKKHINKLFTIDTMAENLESFLTSRIEQSSSR